MKLTDIFIRRPVLAIVVNLILLLVGLQAVRLLNVRQYPRIDSAKVTITTAYVGANADLIRGFITTPLERAIASADGIDYMESSSAQSVSTITAYLKLNFDVNAALAQISSKIDQVRNELPPESEAPVINTETTDSQTASMYLSFYSDALNQNQITDYLTRVVQPQLSAVPGVQKADILGARTFAMRIWLKPERLAALKLSPSDVRARLAANNYLSAVGATKGSMVQVNLVANTDLRSPEEFENMVIREQNGTIIRLRDVADVELGAESYDEEVRFDGQKATFMGIWVLPNANSIDVIREVRKVLPGIEKQLPSGMKLGIPYDATEYINDAIKEITKTLGETLLIVVAVIFLFMGSFRSVLIPVIAMPLSLIGAAFIMLVMGFTINLLTLLAIVLAVGLVVDDAIVVVENVERHIREGATPYAAAIAGARELVGPIIAMTLTLATVYAPIGFQGGLTGALFREFAFTLAGAVVVSGFVALTLSPMMSSKLLKPHSEEGRIARVINSTFDAVRRVYERVLASTLRWRAVTITLWLIVILLSIPFVMFSQSELAPKEDQGFMFNIVNAAPNASLDQTVLFSEKMNDIFLGLPETDHTFQLIQRTGGFGGMTTKPWSQRERTTEQMLPEIYGKLSQLAGIQAISIVPEPLPGAGTFPVEFVISSTDEPERMVEYANQLVGAAFGSQKFMYADTDLKLDQPQVEVVLDRDKIAALGMDQQQIGADLSSLMSGGYVNRFNMQGRSYKVIPQAKRIDRLNPDQMSTVYVTGREGELVPLSTFASLKETTQPRSLNRFQQLNSAKIQGVNAPGVTPAGALAALEEAAKKILPPGYLIDYGGASRQLRKEGNAMMATLGFAMILIFLVLAAQFESFRDPFIILLGSVPLALSGSLLFTFLGFTSLNIYSQVGLVTLVGLVSKNAILIVEFANELQRSGKSKLEAVKQASAVRLRPILMTSAATIIGHFPLVLVTGAGAAARNSIGIVLVTGMTIGTLFTLFVTPSIYMLLAKDHSGEQFNDPEEDEDVESPEKRPELEPALV